MSDIGEVKSVPTIGTRHYPEDSQMKRQSTRKTASNIATDVVDLAGAGAEIVAAGVLLTAGIVGATAELAVAKVLMSEKHPDHDSTSAS